MTLESVRTLVNTRLDQADRGDRAWFMVTRVHLTAGRLLAIIAYLYDAGFSTAKALTASDYAALAEVTGVRSAHPGVGLRRHQLLALVNPLALVERTDGLKWSSVRLTERGLELAAALDPVKVFDQCLSDIVFCREPWFSQRRVAEYEEFDIHPYLAAIEVMQLTEGWIDRDEYDLFLSRVRNEGEIVWAAHGIAQYRELAPAEQQQVRLLVRQRMPSDKTYQNGRDMGFHTFSLLSIGEQALRQGTTLQLTETTSMGHDPTAEVSTRAPSIVRRDTTPPVQPPRAPVTLKLIEVAENEDDALVTPPVLVAANSGSDGELLVAKLLVADGWRVVYYTNKRGFGFDLWATRDNIHAVFEVKSSLKEAGSVTFSRLEYEAATTYGKQFVLAIAEGLSSGSPKVHWIVNPREVVAFQEATTTEFRVARSSWISHTSSI